jgi:hypothetical protein
MTVWASASTPGTVKAYEDRDLGIHLAGAYSEGWDGRVVALSGAGDGRTLLDTRAVGEHFYASDVLYTPPGGYSQSLILFFRRDFVADTATVQGLFDPASYLSEVVPEAGATVRPTFALYDESTGLPTGATETGPPVTVPASGLSLVTTAVPPGPYDLAVTAEDYAENLAADHVDVIVTP